MKDGNDWVAQFIADATWGTLPAPVQRKVRMALLDILGATLVGTLTPISRITTDYAVAIFYAAIQYKSYTCYLQEGTYLDMMYMPDAIQAAIELMEADPSRLKHRNAFNVTAMSFAPEHICAEIQKHIPDFTMDYQLDPVRQAIANSWPNKMDDSTAREEWGWSPAYDLPRMTEDMLRVLLARQEKGEL